MITLINARSKDSQCKYNSNREQTNGNYIIKGRTSNIPCIFNFNPIVNKSCIICFTIFSILLPIGIQPQIESNYVFAEIDSQTTNGEVEYSDDENSLLSSTSESKSNLNVKNPFGSTGDNNKKVKTNILSLEKTSSTESSLTSSSQSAQAQSSNEVYGDFNGDGFDDLAIGVPGEDLGSIFNADAGAVAVIYGSSNGLSATLAHADQFWTQDSADIENQAETGDQFGRSLAIGDFNGDGFDDLAIGVSQEDSGTVVNSGGVEVIYGSSAGLSTFLVHADQFWTQNSADVEDSAEGGDQFGSSLTAGDFNADGKDDLAIGVPFEGLGSIHEAGGVEVIYGSSSGLSATFIHADEFWTQDTTNIDNQAETGDQFGSSLTAGDFNADGKDDLAIGVRLEGLGSISHAGGVEVIYGFSAVGLSATLAHADQFWTQDSADIENQVEDSDQFGFSLTAGDFNADGKDDLAIGVPHEGLGSILIAGGVEVIYGSSSGLSATLAHADQFWTQDSADIDNQAEGSDQFGTSLTAGDFNADGKDDLAIGVPHEDSGSPGGVQVIYGSSSGLSATLAHVDQFWTQDSAEIDNQAEDGDLFGYTLANGDFNGDGKDDLAVGVPFEDLGSIGNAGSVEVIYGSSSGLSATSAHADQFWTQDSANINDSAEIEDLFALSLG